MTVKDGNSNSYTVTPDSPSTYEGTAGQVWLFYLLSAPANASATITASWTTSVSCAIFASEFSYSGTASYDIDAAAYTGTAGTTINTPSITGAGSGELLYSAAAAGGNVSAPTAGNTLGGWTGAGINATSGDAAEYILSSSGSSTAVDYTQSSGTWSAMAMAIKVAVAFPGDEDFWAGLKPAPSDSPVTVWS
jgi:hypothetical protein